MTFLTNKLEGFFIFIQVQYVFLSQGKGSIKMNAEEKGGSLYLTFSGQFYKTIFKNFQSIHE
jgi:hypothetical protein